MPSTPVSEASRNVVIIGAAGLLVVLLLIASQDEGPVGPPTAPAPASVAGDGQAAGGPVARATKSVQETGSDLPQAGLTEGQDREPADLLAALADLAQHRGRLVRCRNTIESLPAFAEADAPGKAGGLPILPIYCGSEGRGVRIHLHFERETLAALPAIGRDSEILLQLLERDAAGVVGGRFIQILGRPRLSDPAVAGLPDLLGLWIADQPAGEIVCHSADAPALVAAGAPGQASAHGPALALVSCRDRRDVFVPILLQFSADQGLALLDVGRATTLRVVLSGRVRGQLVGAWGGILGGAMPAVAGDLRAVLLQPEAHLGELMRCRSMGVPLPLSLAPSDGEVALPAGARLADRKTWLVCRHPTAPPVHINLLFRAEDKHQLLAIGRGTDVQVKALAVAGDRIHGLFEAVLARPVAAATQIRDLRRLGLQTEAFLGKSVTCTLLHAIDRAAAGELPVSSGPVRAAGGQLIQCDDALRPGVGQEVALGGVDASAALKLPAGARVRLTLTGFSNNVPVATLIKASSDRPGGPVPSAPGSTSSPLPAANAPR